jgi:hypothetical protein
VSSTGVTWTPEQVRAWRDQRYRRKPHLKVRTPQEALAFVEDVGFCFLFPARKVEMPSLWEAICGGSRPLPVHHDDRELGYAWNWKDDLPTRGLVFYGKLLRRKPMLVSLTLLPHFYALSENYGELDDYLAEYADGKLSEEAKRVYEALLENGALPTSHLRRRAGLAGKGNARRFDRAILELQLGLKIVKTGISDANAWKYCYVYDLLLRRWPNLPGQAAAISTPEAMRCLLLTYLSNVGVARVHDLARLFAWEPGQLVELCDTLAATGELLVGVDVQGVGGDYVASMEFLSSVSSPSP